MSTSIMSNCWPIRDLSPAQKSVLISLADNANDDGVCWPSVAKIAIRTCLSERAVQAAIRSLMDRGFLTSNQRSGRSTVYTINHRAICTPADAAPPQEIHPTPAGDAPPPPQMPHPTPADAAPRTVKEPSIEPKEKRQKAKSLYSFDQMMAIAPEGLSESVARDYFESRKRKEPLTETAWKRLVTELEKCRAAGYSPDDALGECLVAGWKAVKLEWLVNRLQAKGAGTRRSGFTDLPQHTADQYGEGNAW